MHKDNANALAQIEREKNGFVCSEYQRQRESMCNEQCRKSLQCEYSTGLGNAAKNNQGATGKNAVYCDRTSSSET